MYVRYRPKKHNGRCWMCLAVVIVLLLQPVFADFSNDEITIASEPDYPPYCMVDSRGEASGFAVELFLAAAGAAGLKVRIKTGVWDKIKHDLADGTIDALPLVGRTPEREKEFDFTMSYLSLHGAIFVRKGTKGIVTIEDLKDKTIVVMKGDNAEEFVRREKISSNIVTTNTFEEAFLQLAAGDHDALITQRVVGLNLLDSLKITTVVPLNIQLPQFRQDFCFAVKKGNIALLSRLNEGLSIIIADKTYEQIRHKWFGPVYTERIAFRDMLRQMVLILIPFIIVIAVIAIVALRREVIRQTAGLNREIQEHRKTLSVLREREAHLRKITDNVSDVVWATDLQLNLTYVSPSVRNLLGISPEEYLKHEPDERHPPETLLRFKEILAEELEKENSPAREKDRSRIIEGEHLTQDGKCIPISMHVSFIRDESDQPVGILGVSRDMTVFRKAQEELQHLKDELEETVIKRTRELEEKIQKLNKSEQAMLFMVEDLNDLTAELQEERQKLLDSNQELEAFTYSVSHDLRAPLRAIDGYSKFLVEDFAEALGSEGKRFIDVIRSNTIKMDRLITDLLHLSRVSRIDMNPVEVDMPGIARSMFLEVANEEQKRIFKVVIYPMPSVVCDVTLIKQVWQNLMSNALKYSSAAECKKIEINAVAGEGEIVFSIEDQGAGFDARYSSKLFGLFQRLHTEAEFEGTGVGLAIVKRIVQRHNGRVWAEGKVGKGATFYFSLPKK